MSIKCKCNACGYVFPEDDAGQRSELVDSGPGYKYFESYRCCPECGYDDFEEVELSEACEEYDEEFGCEGVCDECPLMQEQEDIND